MDSIFHDDAESCCQGFFNGACIVVDECSTSGQDSQTAYPTKARECVGWHPSIAEPGAWYDECIR